MHSLALPHLDHGARRSIEAARLAADISYGSVGPFEINGLLRITSIGDVEQIIVLKSTSDRASIVGQGSIDDPTTRDAACNVLEGAVEAFKARARVYGVAG